MPRLLPRRPDHQQEPLSSSVLRHDRRPRHNCASGAAWPQARELQLHPPVVIPQGKFCQHDAAAGYGQIARDGAGNVAHDHGAHPCQISENTGIRPKDRPLRPSLEEKPRPDSIIASDCLHVEHEQTPLTRCSCQRRVCCWRRLGLDDCQPLLPGQLCGEFRPKRGAQCRLTVAGVRTALDHDQGRQRGRPLPCVLPDGQCQQRQTSRCEHRQNNIGPKPSAGWSGSLFQRYRRTVLWTCR